MSKEIEVVEIKRDGERVYSGKIALYRYFALKTDRGDLNNQELATRIHIALRKSFGLSMDQPQKGEEIASIKASIEKLQST